MLSIKFQRNLFLALLLIWVAYIILYPVWRGSIYTNSSGSFRDGGAFALEGHNTSKLAPIWDPPKPSQPEYYPKYTILIRWPWQSIKQRNHIDIPIATMLSRLTFCIATLGLILRISTALTAPGQTDPIVTRAWSMSLALATTGVCLLAFGIFTMGYGLVDEIVSGALLLGLTVGFIHGCIRISKDHSIPKQTRQPLRLKFNKKSILKFSTSGLFGFLIGIFFALAIIISAFWIAHFFRGPVLGMWELGGTRYANDQTTIDFIMVASILATGLITGTIMLSFHSPRGFPIGLFIVTSIPFIMFLIGYS